MTRPAAQLLARAVADLATVLQSTPPSQYDQSKLASPDFRVPPSQSDVLRATATTVLVLAQFLLENGEER